MGAENEINDPGAGQIYLHTPVSFTASGDNTVITGVPGKRIAVYKMFIVAAASVNATFKSGIGTNLTGAVPMGHVTLDVSQDRSPWFVTNVGEGFVINLSGAVQVSGIVYYRVILP